MVRTPERVDIGIGQWAGTGAIVEVAKVDPMPKSAGKVEHLYDGIPVMLVISTRW
jgi:hypothetical protein